VNRAELEQFVKKLVTNSGKSSPKVGVRCSGLGVVWMDACFGYVCNGDGRGHSMMGVVRRGGCSSLCKAAAG
jgi:hypothetical protein